MKVVFKTAESRTQQNQRRLRPATLPSDLAKKQGDINSNDISKIREEIVGSNRRPSIQKIDPNFYFPVRQESFREDRVKLGIDNESFEEEQVKLGSDDNEVYSNFRRHSPNNAELVKQV